MILYGLICSHQHGFEGWFNSSAEYDRQATAGLIACPVCNDVAVHKAPMAPHIARHARTPAAERPVAPTGAAPAASDEVTRMIGDFCKSVEATHDYVGKEFPEEARKIHYGETTTRGIYGEATKDEAVALKDEGIAIAPVPWIKKSDA